MSPLLFKKTIGMCTIGSKSLTSCVNSNSSHSSVWRLNQRVKTGGLPTHQTQNPGQIFWGNSTGSQRPDTSCFSMSQIMRQNGGAMSTQPSMARSLLSSHMSSRNSRPTISSCWRDLTSLHLRAGRYMRMHICSYKNHSTSFVSTLLIKRFHVETILMQWPHTHTPTPDLRGAHTTTAVPRSEDMNLKSSGLRICYRKRSRYISPRQVGMLRGLARIPLPHISQLHLRTYGPLTRA